MQDRIRIYQVRPEYLRSHAFRPLAKIRQETGQEKLPREIWEKVYEGSGFAGMSLDEIYIALNSRESRPAEFTGHSMSVSDLVERVTDDGTGLWFCDTFGWKEVEWAE